VESRALTIEILGALAAAIAVLALGVMPLGVAWRVRAVRHPDGDALADAGWTHGIARWEAIRIASAVTGVVIVAAVGVAPLVGVAAAVAPSIVIRLRAEAARDRARASVAQLLVTAHAMLRSGVAIPEALRRASSGCDDRLARRPFELALTRFDLGDPLDVCIRDAAREAPDSRSAEMLHTLALGITERLPIERAASLLEALADRAVHEQRLAAEVRARSSGARTQSYLLAVIVPGLALYLVATMPGLGATLASPLGRFVLVPIAAGLELGGILLGRRIVRQGSR
jgi:Flp pilus assembly protein TadB